MTETIAGRLPHGDAALIGQAIPCFRCGVCCRKYQARLELEEAEHIAAYLKILLADLVEKYTDHRWPGQSSYLLRHQDKACIFLSIAGPDRRTDCLIHPVRPQCCREWTAGLSQPECREGLARDWHLAITLAGELSGTEAALASFYSFLKSLKKWPKQKNGGR
ncbi:MAG: YkgJ family cysteine cluster protein [Chloroflexi bacterium]|nr:YkgJ family cysteine cluster protein [Chloroflexota bacterium]